MKRIINTAIIAVVIATIGTLDAKQLRRRQQATIATTTMEQQPIPNNTARILQASEQVVENPTDQSVEELTQALDPKKQSLEERELIVLKNERDIIKNRIEFRTKEISSINYGWFGYGLLKETREKYQNAKKLRKNLEKVLAEVQAEIDGLEGVTGKDYSAVIDVALTALKIAGVIITATAADHYILGGAVRTFIGTKMSRAVTGEIATQQEQQDASLLQKQANKAAAQKRLVDAKARQRISSAKEAKRLSPRK